MKFLKRILAILLIANLLAVSLYNISNAAEGTTFSDINNHWSKNTVLWAVERGMVKGYVDGTFKPDQQVTESEFLAMLIRSFEDVKQGQGGNWADPYYQKAKEKNYPVKGFDNVFKRNEVITRGYVAELVSSTQGVNYAGEDAIRYMLGEGLAKGTTGKITIKDYNAKGKLSRAEAVQFLKNLIEKGADELKDRPKDPSDTSKLPNIPTGNKMYGNVEYDESATPIDLSKKIPVDPKAHEICVEFVKSVYLKDGKIHFTIPKNIPKDHDFNVRFRDQSGPNGERNFKNDVEIDFAKAGQSYSIPYYGNGGYLAFNLSKRLKNDYPILDSGTIFVPSLKMVSSSEGWE
jgi:hypothetical protein